MFNDRSEDIHRDAHDKMMDTSGNNFVMADEELLKFERAMKEEALGLNKHAHQEFVDSAETPSLLVILTSLLWDLLSDDSSSYNVGADGGDSSSNGSYNGLRSAAETQNGWRNRQSVNAAGIFSSSRRPEAVVCAQQKARRERERRPLAEDWEYLHAMACPQQHEQQQQEGCTSQQQQQQGEGSSQQHQQQQREKTSQQQQHHQGEGTHQQQKHEEGTRHHLQQEAPHVERQGWGRGQTSQGPREQQKHGVHVSHHGRQQIHSKRRTRSQQRQDEEAARDSGTTRETLSLPTAAPPAASSLSTGEQEEDMHYDDATALEGVSFVIEEDSPTSPDTSPVKNDRGDMLSDSCRNDSGVTGGAKWCCVPRSRPEEDSHMDNKNRSTSGDSDTQFTKSFQQKLGGKKVEEDWEENENDEEDDSDSLYPTRCSSGDEQQWDGATTATTRMLCVGPSGRAPSTQQQEPLKKRLQREQIQQEQLKELMWGVAAAFEIQQLHPPRVRAKTKRMCEASAKESHAKENSSTNSHSGATNATDGESDGGSSGHRVASTGHNISSRNRAGLTTSETQSGRSDSVGQNVVSSSPSNTRVNVKGSTSNTSACNSGSTNQTSGTGDNASANKRCSEDCCSGKTRATKSSSSINEVAEEARSWSRQKCEIRERADTGGNEIANGNKSSTVGGGAGGLNNHSDSTSKETLLTGGSKEDSSSECKNHGCLDKDNIRGPTGGHSVESKKKDVADTVSDADCRSDKKEDKRTCEDFCTVKRLKREPGVCAISSTDGTASSSANSGANVVRNNICSSSTSRTGNIESTGVNSKRTSDSISVGFIFVEGRAACAHEETLSNTSTSGNTVERGMQPTGTRELHGSDSLKRSRKTLDGTEDTPRDTACTGMNTPSNSPNNNSTASANVIASRMSDTNAATHNVDSRANEGGSNANEGGLKPKGVCGSEQDRETGEAATAEEFPAWRCCCGEGEAEAPAAVWKSRGLLPYDALYDRWRTFLTQFAPSGLALAVCFGKSYLFHILHESLWQLLEELRLTAAGETPQRLRTFVLRLAAAAGLSSTHAQQLLSKTLFQHGNPADSILPSETGLGFLHRDAGGAREEQLGIISFCCITNDRQPQHLLQLLTIKSIFSRQLPKMPREYIVRLVFDRNHFTFCLCKRGRVTGGVCFRPYFKERFAEIAFLAVTSTEQVKGYGTRLMNHLKEHVKKSNIEYFLTYADNFALGYFRKQGFSSRITMPRDRWVGYIKDYDGGTLMECKISQKINYLRLSQLLAKQKLAVKRFIDVCSPAPLCPPITFWKENPGKLLSPLEIPALVKLGYTTAHWIAMQQLLPATAVCLSATESEEQASRRTGSAGPRSASIEARTVEDEKKQRDSRTRGADSGDGRCTNISLGRGGPPAANIDGVATQAATASGAVGKISGVHPYIPHFGATGGGFAATASAGQSFKARVAALLSCLDKHSSSWPFRKPVSVNEAPDYYEVISRPMDISSMKKKNRAGEYQTVAAVRADLQLMFDNCRLYNSQETIYYKYADELQAFIWPKLNLLEESAVAS